MLEELIGKRVDLRIETGRHELKTFAGQTVRGKVLAVAAGGLPEHPPRAFVDPEVPAGRAWSEVLLRVEFDASPSPSLERLRATPVPVRITLFGDSGHRMIGDGTGSLALAVDPRPAP